MARVTAAVFRRLVFTVDTDVGVSRFRTSRVSGREQGIVEAVDAGAGDRHGRFGKGGPADVESRASPAAVCPNLGQFGPARRNNYEVYHMLSK